MAVQVEVIGTRALGERIFPLRTPHHVWVPLPKGEGVAQSHRVVSLGRSRGLTACLSGLQAAVEVLRLEAGTESAKSGKLDQALRNAEVALASWQKCGGPLRWAPPPPGFSSHPAQVPTFALAFPHFFPIFLPRPSTTTSSSSSSPPAQVLLLFGFPPSFPPPSSSSSHPGQVHSCCPSPHRSSPTSAATTVTTSSSSFSSPLLLLPSSPGTFLLSLSRTFAPFLSHVRPPPASPPPPPPFFRLLGLLPSPPPFWPASR